MNANLSIGDDTRRRIASEGAAASSGSCSLSPGRTLGPYRVVRLLGRGGMGEVYEVRHGVLDRVFALKLLTPALAAASPKRLGVEQALKVIRWRLALLLFCLVATAVSSECRADTMVLDDGRAFEVELVGLSNGMVHVLYQGRESRFPAARVKSLRVVRETSAAADAEEADSAERRGTPARPGTQPGRRGGRAAEPGAVEPAAPPAIPVQPEPAQLPQLAPFDLLAKLAQYAGQRVIVRGRATQAMTEIDGLQTVIEEGRLRCRFRRGYRAFNRSSDVVGREVSIEGTVVRDPDDRITAKPHLFDCVWVGL